MTLKLFTDISDFVYLYLGNYRKLANLIFEQDTAIPRLIEFQEFQTDNPWLNDKPLKIIKLKDGFVFWDESNAPKNHWYFDGGPALKIDELHTRTPLSVRTLLSSRSSIQKPQGISRAILEDSVPPKIWLGDLNLIIENQEEKAYGEKICRYLESSIRLEDWLAAASFGFFDSIFTLPKIPDNYSSTPFEIISNLGFFPADLNNSYFFSSLSIMTDNFQISKFKNTAQTGIKNAIFRDLLRSISKKHFDSSDFIRQFSYKKFWDPSSDEKNTDLIKQLNQIKLSSN